MMEDNMSALLPMAREIVAKAYRKGSVVYRGIIGGQFDRGRLVQDALKELVNAGGPYPKLPEEREPERPVNAIDDE
jgi:hypothetical protein